MPIVNAVNQKVNFDGIVVYGTQGFAGEVSGLFTLPPFMDMATSETFPYTVDITNYTQAGDAPVVLGLGLYLVASNTLIRSVWYTSPVLVGNILEFSILGSVLQKGQQYQIQVITKFNANKILGFVTNLNMVA